MKAQHVFKGLWICLMGSLEARKLGDDKRGQHRHGHISSFLLTLFPSLCGHLVISGKKKEQFLFFFFYFLSI